VADFVRALAYAIGNDAVQTERREQQCHQRERVDQPGRKAALCELSRDQIFPSPHGVERQVRIGGVHCLLDDRCGRRRAVTARHDRERQGRGLQQ
jgi:hypothetical protein